MDYSHQKKFFQTAYTTGSDYWSRLPLTLKGDELMRTLQPGAMILDVGSGRGRFPFELATQGFRVIGIDIVPSIVAANNAEVKNFKLESKLRFIEGDIFDIPLTDASFDAVTDIGLLQHIHPEDWSEYRNEITRVLKSGGYFFLVTLSKETLSYLSWKPKQDAFGDFSREGVFFHFFTDEQLSILFENDFELVSKHTEIVDTHGDKVAYTSMLMRKK